MGKLHLFTVFFSIVLIVGIIGSIVEYVGTRIRANNGAIYKNGIKRGLDLICGILAISVLWPVYLIVAVLVKIKLGSPILFTQMRPGKDGKLFKLYKFRTMTDERDINGNFLTDGERLTKFGRSLRSTSLDELPEAINIIKGDMSVIGPRPLLIQYLDRYSEHQKHRHDVRPGLSGWAQVNGRNTLSWQKKFDMDVWYSQNATFSLDVRIVIDTVIQAFIKREGINSDTSDTMEEFMGNGRD